MFSHLNSTGTDGSSTTRGMCLESTVHTRKSQRNSQCPHLWFFMDVRGQPFNIDRVRNARDEPTFIQEQSAQPVCSFFVGAIGQSYQTRYAQSKRVTSKRTRLHKAVWRSDRESQVAVRPTVVLEAEADHCDSQCVVPHGREGQRGGGQGGRRREQLCVLIHKPAVPIANDSATKTSNSSEDLKE